MNEGLIMAQQIWKITNFHFLLSYSKKYPRNHTVHNGDFPKPAKNAPPLECSMPLRKNSHFDAMSVTDS